MQLRPYQQLSDDALWKDLCSLPGNPLIVSPTGSGKSALIGTACSRAVEKFNGRVIVAAHRKELLDQNADKIQRFTSVRVGKYSAGLREFDTEADIICGGIQSIYNKAALFGRRNLLLIDEAHLVPPTGEGMYQKFINDLRTINPKLRIAGFTATPFRTNSGVLIGPNTIFQRIAHETQILPLISQGYLCRLTTESAASSYDTSSIHVRGGEFVQGELERLFADHVGEACKEIVANTKDRHSVLIFCQGVSHAVSVAECIEKMTGEEVGIVTGETAPLLRATTLARFGKNQLRFLVNVDVLTTGFDAPCIDAIAVLRATMSPGLFAQIVGRGLRIHESKADCLILDFGQNVERHGKLDDPMYGRFGKQGKGKGGGEAPEKNCPNCEEANPVSTRECKCGYRFPIEETKHDTQAANAELLGYKSESEWFAVNDQKHSRHTKNDGGPDSLKVTYECVREGGNMPEFISEWVCFNHSGFARQKANLWWSARSSDPSPVDIDEALQVVDGLRIAKRIKAHKEGRFWRIDEVELGEVVEAYPRHYCPACDCEVEPYKKEVGQDTGLFCYGCNGWIKWIEKSESVKYQEECPF